MRQKKELAMAEKCKRGKEREEERKKVSNFWG